MANTSALQEAIEWARGELGQRHGIAFRRPEVRLRTGGSRAFNAVAANGSVVATITNSSGATSGGKKPVGKIRGAVAELYYLSLVDAADRLLVGTNEQFVAYLEAELRGALADGLTIVHLALPSDLASKVADVSKSASDEMRAPAS